MKTQTGTEGQVPEFLGIINETEEDQLAKWLDKKIDWRKIIKSKIIGAVAEMVDGKIFSMSISALDDKFGDKLPAEYKKNARLVVQGVIEDDTEKVMSAIPGVLNQTIDIPGINEDQEFVILKGLTDTIWNLIQTVFKKKADQPV